MDITAINDHGLVLLGCGKMGSALLAGWLERGVNASAVHVIEPHPSDWLIAQNVSLNGDLPSDPAIVLLAVKPQMMQDAMPALSSLTPATVVLSIAAGTSIATFEEAFGAQMPVIRSMPNTPAAVGRGITAIVGNAQATASHMDLAEGLLSAVGQVVRLENEAQIDAVTGVSGSGPAYVFHLIECLAAAGEAEGLAPELAMRLAKATVAGAGDLAEQSDDDPAQLRVNVTSPAGTAAPALDVLLEAETGFPPLLRRAVKAATERGRELGRG